MRLGYNQVTFPLAITTDTVVLAPNPRRRGLIISSPLSGTVWFRVGAPAASQSGFAVPTATAALQLYFSGMDFPFHEEIHAFSSAANNSANLTEIVEL